MISKRRTRRPRRTWTRTRTRTGEKQAKRKPRPRPRANRDSKDSLEQEKETGQEKWNPRVQGKGKGKGVTCWLLLRRVKVGPKQKQEPRAKPKIWRVVGVIFNANQRGEEKRLQASLPLRLPAPKGPDNWSITLKWLRWVELVCGLASSFYSLSNCFCKNANFNNYE